MHLYREHFLRKFHKDPAILYLDATGSVTRQVGDERPYVYALVSSRGPGNKYRLRYMLTESHTVSTIEHFLSQMSRDFKLVNKDSLSAARLVVGFSNAWRVARSVEDDSRCLHRGVLASHHWFLRGAKDLLSSFSHVLGRRTPAMYQYHVKHAGVKQRCPREESSATASR